MAEALPVDQGSPVGEMTHVRRIRSILVGSAGNLVEWFDFYTYAFTALYFASSFFPKADPLAQLVATSGIYAVGFFVRPLGGWFFGRYADRHGRQSGVVLSLLMMGFGSLFISVLPTYGQVGFIAPILLLLGRMIQGFATGGQYGTIAAYLSEAAGNKHRGFFASFHFVSLIGGQLLATSSAAAPAIWARAWRSDPFDLCPAPRAASCVRCRCRQPSALSPHWHAVQCHTRSIVLSGT